MIKFPGGGHILETFDRRIKDRGARCKFVIEILYLIYSVIYFLPPKRLLPKIREGGPAQMGLPLNCKWYSLVSMIYCMSMIYCLSGNLSLVSSQM